MVSSGHSTFRAIAGAVPGVFVWYRRGMRLPELELEQFLKYSSGIVRASDGVTGGAWVREDLVVVPAGAGLVTEEMHSL